METAIVLDLPLEALDNKISQVVEMRERLALQLEDLSRLYLNQDKLMHTVETLKLKLTGLNGCCDVRDTIKQQLRSYQRVVVDVVGEVQRAYQQAIQRMRNEFSRQICQKDNEINKQYLITKSLKSEVAKLKPVGKENQPLQKKNSRSLFKPQRFSLQFHNRLSNQITPVKFVKTTLNSPEILQEQSIDKDSLLDISPTSIKKANDSLFFQLDIQSKRKQFVVDTPFEAEESRVEDSVQNTGNVFAKLTFGKDKGRYLHPDKHNHFMKSSITSLNNVSTNSSHKNSLKKLQNNGHNAVQVSKRFSMNLETEKRKLDYQDNIKNQQTRYKEIIRSIHQKQNLKKQKKLGLYVGDPNKEVRYQGLRRDGKKSGRGTLYYSDGLVFEGEFKNNLRDGFGTLKFQHGEVYSGDWSNDFIHGQGRLRNCQIVRKNVEYKATAFSAWINYTGKFKSNIFHGTGTLQLPNNQKFIGEFCNGRVEGQGTHYKSDGNTIFGIWKNNRLVQQI